MIRRVKKGFTLLELVIVIIVMGIVAKFGVELLVRAYDYYIMSSAESRFQNQSEIAVEQIANRLAYRIPGSEIVRLQQNGLNNYTSIATSAQGNTSNTVILEWVGYDIDGWRGDGNNIRPTWSGFVDVNRSILNGQNGELNTTESNSTRITGVITALSPSRATGAWNGNGLGLFFIQDANFNVQDGFGWNGVAIVDQSRTAHRVNATNDNRLAATVGNFAGQDIYEFYRLSWTAYALVYDKAARTITLRYDYRPWNGETYNTNGVSSRLLMENVDSFRFRSAGDAIKVQVCIRDEDLFTQGAFSICKEKTVF